MKDNISLIAAAAGGFMLSMALTGILHGAPITSLSQPVKVEVSRQINVGEIRRKPKESIIAVNKSH